MAKHRNYVPLMDDKATDSLAKPRHRGKGTVFVTMLSTTDLAVLLMELSYALSQSLNVAAKAELTTLYGELSHAYSQRDDKSDWTYQVEDWIEEKDRSI